MCYTAIADLPDVFTVDEAVDKMGFGLFQVLLCMFAGSIWVSTCGLAVCLLCLYVCEVF